MRKILLARVFQPYPVHVAGPPLGLMHLASAIRKFGKEQYQIKIVDMNLTRMKPEKLKEVLQDFDPELVGLSALAFERQAVHRTARLIKEFKPDCRVVVGGPYGTMWSTEILQDNRVDWVVIGEGEITFTELLDTYFRDGDITKVEGIAYRQNGNINHSGNRKPVADLDTLPFPAWDLVDIPAYSRWIQNANVILAARPYMYIFTSRGCPFQCAYCHDILGKSIREASPQNVLEQIKILVSRYRIKEFHIVDDCFNYHAERAKEICRRIIAEGLKIKIAFPNGIRADLLDRELLSLLKKAGAYILSFAVESASLRIQKMIKKNLDLNKTIEMIIAADQLGFLTKGYFMIGFPTETQEEINKTVDFAVKSPLLFASFFNVVPFRKTPLYELARLQYPDIDNIDYDLYYYGKSFYSFATGFDLNKTQRKAYWKFYFPGRIFRIMRKPFLKFYSFRQIFISFLMIYLGKSLKRLRINLFI
ncbi:MAG: radical SAM protein [Proteobacteria bacterium]|nr:radical SAM protein [Pseudomonadota bacterium]